MILNQLRGFDGHGQIWNVLLYFERKALHKNLGNCFFPKTSLWLNTSYLQKNKEDMMVDLLSTQPL